MSTDMIPIRRASRFAIERARQVLIHGLGPVLEEERLHAGLSVQPAPAARYVMGTPPVSPEDMIVNAPVWISVYAPTGPATSSDERSDVGGVYGQEIQTDVRADVIFAQVNAPLPKGWSRADGSTPSDDEARQTMADVMQLRADVYAGAVLETLLKYMVGGAAITDVHYQSASGTWLPGRDRIFGAAEVVVRVVQDTAIPIPTPITIPDAPPA